MNPYTKLGISPKLSLKGLIENLKSFGQFSDEQLQDLMNSLKNKSQNEQRQIVLDKLIQVKYEYCKQDLPRKVEKFSDATASTREKVMKIEKEQALLQEAYEMICTEEKREKYASQIGKKEGLTAEKKVQIEEEYNKLLQEAYKMCKPQKAPKFVPEKNMENSTADVAKSEREWDLSKLKYGRGDRTKGVRSRRELTRITQIMQNKEEKDPEDQYPNYTGYPYEWGAALDGFVFMLEKNRKQETVLVTKLGKFYYRRVEGPCDESGERGFSYIIGITKMNQQEEIIRNDIMVADLKSSDKEEDSYFFKNVFLSDEFIDHAKLVNQSFMGSVEKTKNKEGKTEYYVEYNAPFSTQLVTALTVADYTPGLVRVKDGQTKRCRFWEIKKNLEEFQKKNFEDCIHPKKTSNPIEKEKQGEEKYE